MDCARRYSVRVGEACCIGIEMQYEVLLLRIMEFTMRAAIAKSADDSEWEHEQLRKHGIGALQVFRSGKALWESAPIFNEELAEAQREGIPERFQAENELDTEFFARLDRDLCVRWSHLGYHAESLRGDMKVLFSQLERDASQRADAARSCFFSHFISTLQDLP